MSKQKTVKNTANSVNQDIATMSPNRISFAKVKFEVTPPPLIDIQLESFRKFFSMETPPNLRKKEGLYQVFKEFFPISDPKENFKVEFLDYSLEPPKYSIQECKERGLTYSVGLKVKFLLYSEDEENYDFEPISQDVYLGNIPYMTPQGTFIINGAERVIVSQIHRAPGVFFKRVKDNKGNHIYSAKIIPATGSWLEITTDSNNVLYTYVDSKRKFPATTLLRAIGFSSDKDILRLFGFSEEVILPEEDEEARKVLEGLVGRKLAASILRHWVEEHFEEDTGEVTVFERSESVLERGHILGEEDIDKILEVMQDAEDRTIVLVSEKKKENEDILPHAVIDESTVILNTLTKDNTHNTREALEHIYKVIRGGDPPDEDTARNFVHKLFFDDKRYDLGEVGRHRLNKKLHTENPIDEEIKVLTVEDIIAIMKEILTMIREQKGGDDVDHLSNRRVRTVGEQLYNQFRTGLSRLARTLRDRMNTMENDSFTVQDIVNPRTLIGVINSFFGTNPLSQFMDQTNMLSEITHKRRISALGPGGLTKEHAGFEVRDVHYSHYGRLCPIETPEGPNIGLITSLARYARVNRLGFIETPYLKVENGQVLFNEKHYLSPEGEDGKKIAQAKTPLDAEGKILSERVLVRVSGDIPIVTPEEVDYMDVATNQITSVSAALIPFLEHDDANRALMGSNMQRQAVPLLNPEAPIVGTGMESTVAKDSMRILLAERKGVVTYVDASEIHVKYEVKDEEQWVSFEDEIKVYKLIKYKKTNNNTTINMRPVVKEGDIVEKGTVLCEGFGTEKGELALGRNILVAFMPWRGYNFEDAIVLSERLVTDDVYTSVHVEEFETQVRETKLGPEELTNEIPNISAEDLKKLDDRGIIKIGSYVREREILVGKTTPKGQSDPSPEEKLLIAIFGDKAGDIKNTSLKTPPSFKGVVIDTHLFEAAKGRGRKSTKEYKNKQKEIKKIYETSLVELNQKLKEKLTFLLKDKKLNEIKTKGEEIVIPKGKKFKDKYLKGIDALEIIPDNWTEDEKLNALIQRLFHNYRLRRNEIEGRYRRERQQLEIGDELPAQVLKLAKVYVANKRKIKIGDKMAGRHGNKGVVAKIVRREDMPFLEDGTPVDIVLNPLGVPSRMNLGQLLETILGWAGEKLGVKFACPVFDGASTEEINEWLKKANLPENGMTYLYDGLSGERFDQPTTVGYIYMLKLHHLVDDKMHARSTGPYSLITQQPLGGKAQLGGQRLGEMEVWALEAFGASHILREMLTIKSDDVEGRERAYDAIVKGRNIPEPGIPESFNVLINELRGLCLNVTLEK